jgi:hypothetical protein
LDTSLNEIIVVIAAKSAYVGNHHAVGEISRTDIPNNQDANHSFDTDVPLTMVTPNTAQTSVADETNPIYLTVNADNSVSINFLQNVPGPFYPFKILPGVVVTSYASI